MCDIRKNNYVCKSAVKFTLFRTLNNIVMDLMHKNIDLPRKDISKKLMIFGSDRKNDGILFFVGKRSCLKKIRGYNTEEDGGGSRYSFAR